jgi:mannose-1-phosphate guanylyltransferase
LFNKLEGQSIDYGVMEKAGNIHMLPCDNFWSDVGSWAALPEVIDQDASGNVTNGDVLVVESNGCILHSEKRLLACVGLQDLVVVETPEAVLVCPVREAQRVKQVVEELRRRKRKDVL